MKPNVNNQGIQVSASREADVAFGKSAVSQRFAGVRRGFKKRIYSVNLLSLPPVTARAYLSSSAAAAGILTARHILQRGAAHSRNTPAKAAGASGTVSFLMVATTVRPNPSVKRSANGRPPGPPSRYGVHFLLCGPGVLPLAPAYLER